MGTSTGGDETGPAPTCVDASGCGECELCEGGMCVEDPSCEAPECTVDADCPPCMGCDLGECLGDDSCEDSTGEESCEGDTWCEEGVSWCLDGVCTDVAEPAMLDACAAGEPKPVKVEPQIQNVSVDWLDVDGEGSPDIVAAAANSANAWLAPDWTLSKTALTFEGNGMALLSGTPVRAALIGTAASVLAVHQIEDTGSFTVLEDVMLSAAPLQVVALDGDGSGGDDAAIRTDAAIVHIGIEGDTPTEGDVLFDGTAVHMASLRQDGGDQIVAVLDTGRAVLVGAGGEENGLVNPWGGERALAFGGKHGVVGGGAMALSTLEPLETYAAPEGAVAVAAFEGAGTIVAAGGATQLWLYDLSAETPCTVAVEGGPFEAVALEDLGGGTLGVATVVAGELTLFTSDVLDE